MIASKITIYQIKEKLATTSHHAAFNNEQNPQHLVSFKSPDLKIC